MFRKTYAYVDTDILTKNVQQIVSKYNNYQYYIGVVKGNCYGHGMYAVNALIKGGINYLAVSSLEEAMQVREYNKKIPILCLEPICIDYIDNCVSNNVTITVDSMEYFNDLKNLKINGVLKIHLKLDTGMNRLGVKDESDVLSIVNESMNLKNVFLEGIYTHMATTGLYDKHFDEQMERFKYLTKDIDLSKIKMVHIGKSSTLVQHDKFDFVNAVRLGIIMYGFNCSLNVNGKSLKSRINSFIRNYRIKKYNISDTHKVNDLKLNTAMRLYTEVMSIKHVSKGEFIGYGAEYVANSDINVAVLPLGYADLNIANIRFVFINGKRYNVIGKACMDMIMVKCDEQVKLHDKVEIFGDKLSVRNVSSFSSINAYHLFISVTNRVPRVYSDGSKSK